MNAFAITVAGIAIVLVVVRALARARRGRSVSGGTASVSPPAPAVAVDPQIIEIGGRSFRLVENGSSARDTYLVSAFSAAGLMPLPDMTDGETPGEYGLRMLERLGKQKEHVLGGLLVPSHLRDLDWLPEIAADTERHLLNACGAPGDVAKIQNLTLSVMLDFFADGIASYVNSLSSSSLKGTRASDPEPVMKTDHGTAFSVS